MLMMTQLASNVLLLVLMAVLLAIDTVVVLAIEVLVVEGRY